MTRYLSYYTIAKLFIIVFLPLTLIVLPKDFFDKGESICISKFLLDMECYACGLTRACMHLIHFDFEEAFAYNMLSFIVLPLLGVIWIQWFIKEYKILMNIRRSINNPVL